MTKTFLGLDAAAWAALITAVATAVLSFITWRYLRLTRRLVDATNRSAEAMVEANLVALGALPVSFEAEYWLEWDADEDGSHFQVIGIPQLNVTCTGAAVHVHSIAFVQKVAFTLNGRLELAFGGTLEVVDPDEPLPVLRHSGQWVLCRWPGEVLNLAMGNHARVAVTYSVGPATEKRTTEVAVTIPHKEGGPFRKMEYRL